MDKLLTPKDAADLPAVKVAKLTLGNVADAYRSCSSATPLRRLEASKTAPMGGTMVLQRQITCNTDAY